MGLYHDALLQARCRFVGREAEVARFEVLLGNGEARIWWVFGPGGIGKSRLLTVLGGHATMAGREVATVDLRSSDGSVRELTGAVVGQLTGATCSGATVILDAVEPTPAIEDWLRNELLPELPSGSVVLIGSRRPPSVEWRTDPSWSALLELVPLRGLSTVDAERLLVLGGVPAELAPPLVALTHGHPLALQLLVEMCAATGRALPHGLDRAPDLVAALLTRLVDDVPDDRHRCAVELSSLARATTRSMVRDICDAGGAGEIFDWLADQPWMERLPDGLCPHDLARDVIEADLRSNDPDRHLKLARALRTHILDPERVQHDPDRAAADYIHLHRGSSVISSAWDWSTFGATETTELRPGDRDVLAGLVAEHYGPATVPALDHWLERQPHAFAVVRDRHGIVGFAAVFVVGEPTPCDLDADPSLAVVWSRARRSLRPDEGETMGLIRFVCDRDAGTLPPSPTYNVVTQLATRHWLTSPGLGLDYVIKPTAGLYRPMMDYIDFHPVETATHRVGSTEMVVFEHDWRTAPLALWLDRMETLEAGAPFGPAVDPAPVLVALDETAFADAVRSALRDLSRPDRLATNPLLASRVVRDGGDADGPDALRQTLHEAFDALDEHARTERARRAVARTYLHGAVTQEAAAEVLGMAFSTYRRHLAIGTDLLVDRLWRWELYGRAESEHELSSS